jgi:hypothetical protein
MDLPLLAFERVDFIMNHRTSRKHKSGFRATVVSSIVLSVAIPATATILDFEGFPDTTVLTNQYAGVTFTNAIILSAGISLNEFEFPPHSGTNVVSDNNAPMNIDFASPVLSFSGYFTYAEPLTMQALGSSNNQLAGAVSLFSSNDALFGDPGSSPNEFIQVAFASGISSVTITGDLLGGSFVMDDATYTAVGSGTPEPTNITLFLAGSIALVVLRKSSHH